MSQTGVGNTLPKTSVCETTTKSISQVSTSQSSNESNVSKVNHPNSYDTHFPILGKPLIRTTVTRDKQTSHGNRSNIKSLPRQRKCDEQLNPYECNVGQLTNGNSRKGESANQQYMKNGRWCSSRSWPTCQTGCAQSHTIGGRRGKLSLPLYVPLQSR